MRLDLVCEKNVLVIPVRIVANPEMMRKHYKNGLEHTTKKMR